MSSRQRSTRKLRARHYVAILAAVCLSVVLSVAIFRISSLTEDWVQRSVESAVTTPRIDTYRQHQLDMEFIRLAIWSYSASYGQFPIPVDSPQRVDNKELIAILTAATNNVALKRNPQGIRFLNLPEYSLKNGEFLDPWGNPYHIFFNAVGEGAAAHAIDAINKSVRIWSSGPNGIDEDGQGDDITLDATQHP